MRSMLYRHDMLDVFGARPLELRELWEKVMAPPLVPGSGSTVSKASQLLSATSPTICAGPRRFLLNGGSRPKRSGKPAGFHQVFG